MLRGLYVARLSESAQANLKKARPFAGVRNPVDVTAQMVNQMDLLEMNIDVLFCDDDFGASIMTNSPTEVVRQNRTTCYDVSNTSEWIQE